MKKLFAAACTSFMLAAAAMPVLSVSAEKAPDIKITAAISNAGKIEVANMPVTVSDRNEDGKFDIDEALYAVHEQYFDGGASAGYASAPSNFGLSLTKLWGIANGGSYGYYLNDKMAMSLSDEVKDNAYLSAFVYGDTTGFSDKYTYFDIKSASVSAGESIHLKLTIVNFDENWAPVDAPCADAVITINGADTEYKTDANGEVTLPFKENGTYCVSAKAEGKYIAAPVTIVTVGAAETTAPAETADTTTTTTTATDETTAATTTTTTTTTAAATTTTTTTITTTTVATTTTTTTTTAPAATTTKSNNITTVTKTDAAKTGDVAIPAVVLAAALAAGTAYAARRRND